MRGARVLAMLLPIWGVPWAQGYAEAIVQRATDGVVDWTHLQVEAEGTAAAPETAVDRSAARLQAEEAAEQDAKKRVLKVLTAVRLDADRTVGERLDNPRIRVQAQGLMTRCETTETRYLSDGTVDLKVACPLEGGLASVLLPPAEKVASEPPPGGASGLVVKVTGSYDPRLAPRILGPDGREVFGLGSVGPNAVRKWGTVAYADSLDAAKAHPRAGSAAVVVAVQSVENVLQADEAAAALIQGQARALWEGRVLLVLEPPAP